MKSKKVCDEYIVTVGSNILNVEKTYPYSLVKLCDDKKSVGKLIIDEKGGKLRFEGDVEKSAQVFFDEVIKRYAEVYL